MFDSRVVILEKINSSMLWPSIQGCHFIDYIMLTPFVNKNKVLVV